MCGKHQAKCQVGLSQLMLKQLYKGGTLVIPIISPRKRAQRSKVTSQLIRYGSEAGAQAVCLPGSMFGITFSYQLISYTLHNLEQKRLVRDFDVMKSCTEITPALLKNYFLPQHDSKGQQ